jgi:hypothetical protein
MPPARLACAVASVVLAIVVPLGVARSLEAAEAEKGAAGGKVLADSGFRPRPHGFGFENWGGDDYPGSDLTPADAAQLFGDRVCARFKDGQCVPTPAARVWKPRTSRYQARLASRSSTVKLGETEVRDRISLRAPVVRAAVLGAVFVVLPAVLALLALFFAAIVQPSARHYLPVPPPGQLA